MTHVSVFLVAIHPDRVTWGAVKPAAPSFAEVRTERMRNERRPWCFGWSVANPGSAALLHALCGVVQGGDLRRVEVR